MNPLGELLSRKLIVMLLCCATLLNAQPKRSKFVTRLDQVSSQESFSPIIHYEPLPGVPEPPPYEEP